MPWIKRNLYFVIGGGIAVAMMGLAGWWIFQKTGLYNQNKEDLNKAYEELKTLNEAKPHPGDGKVDNVRIAGEQQAQVRELLGKARDYYRHIPPIPDKPKIDVREFTAELRNTIDQLQKDATNSSVALPPRYYFSFEAVKTRMNFTPGSLEPLAAQLGEIKAISDLVIRAKVNALDGIRRERVCTYDLEALGDYLEQKSVTNELAVLTPYEVSFRCFSSELAAVLSGFGNSSNGFIVKNINVEPAGATAAPGALSGFGGTLGTGTEASSGGFSPPPASPTPTTPAVPGGRGGSATVINEHLLKVTLVLNLVKLTPPAKAQSE